VQTRRITNLYECVLKELVAWESAFLLQRQGLNKVFCRVPVLKGISKWVPQMEVDGCV
jgi:hypothetical protein